MAEVIIKITDGEAGESTIDVTLNPPLCENERATAAQQVAMQLLELVGNPESGVMRYDK